MKQDIVKKVKEEQMLHKFTALQQITLKMMVSNFLTMSKTVKRLD